METGKGDIHVREEDDSSGPAINICINDVISFRDAEKVMYCRLCATVNNEAVSIFGKEGLGLNLADKINVALPIWVSSNMGPPFHVCRKCIGSLEATVDFINQVVAAQKKINAVFKVLQDISRRNVPETWKKDPSIPAFITYFKAKNFKKLNTVNKIPAHETNKENEGGEQTKAVAHPLDEKITNSADSDVVSIEGISRSEKEEATMSELPCVVISSDDESMGDDGAADGGGGSNGDDEGDDGAADGGGGSNGDDEGDDGAADGGGGSNGDDEGDDGAADGGGGSDGDNEGDAVSESVEERAVETLAPSAPLNEEASGVVAHQMACASSQPTSSEPVYSNVCKYCDKSFKWGAELLSHHTIVHQDVVFCCRVCFKVFFDNKEVFDEHVQSHWSSAGKDTKGTSIESPPSNLHLSSEPRMESGRDVLSRSLIQKKPRLDHICKYCGEKFLKLQYLYKHQAENHSDVVFRCNRCSKVFYENEEEWRKHEESHSAHRVKYKSEAAGNSRTTMSSADGTAQIANPSLSKKQQEWIKRILSDRPCFKKGTWSYLARANHSSSAQACADILSSWNENSDASPAMNDTANASTPNVNEDATNSPLAKANADTISDVIGDTGSSTTVSATAILPSSVSANKTVLPSVNTDGVYRLYGQEEVDPDVAEENRTTTYTIRLINHLNVTPRPAVPRQLRAVRRCYMCRSCHVEFKREEELALHRLVHHRLKMPCRFCPRTLAHRVDLVEHEAKHFKKHSCRKCKEDFDSEEALKKHKSSHAVPHTLPRFSCQICKRLYVRESELKIHLETHLDERPFLCEKCGSCFKDVPSLKEHRSVPCKTRGSTKSYECDICEQKFRNARLLAFHRIQNHKAVFPCPLCGLVFRSKPAMSGHMNSHDAIVCLVCDQTFANLDLLQRHRKREHPEEEMTEFSAFQGAEKVVVAQLKCDVCEQCFASELTLSVHEATHETSWQCHLCGEAFDAKRPLEAHVGSSHPGERPHKCGTCNRTFSLRHSLRCHEKVHSWEDSHFCAKCGKSFSTTAELSEHVVVHSSDTFPCGFCSMSFSRKISLLIHQRTHTAKMYSCSFCPEKFSQHKHAQQHERSHDAATAGNKRRGVQETSSEVDEGSLAVSLLNMSASVAGFSGDDQLMAEDVIPSATAGGRMGGEAILSREGDSDIIIDPAEYAQVVYVADALDAIL